MKKIIAVLFVCILSLTNFITTYAYSFSTAHGKYTFYERNVGGRSRLTISITNRKISHTEDGAWNLYNDIYQKYKNSHILRPYFNGIYNQIKCHALGEFGGKNKSEWNIEVQRNLGPFWSEWVNSQCNIDRWYDHKYLKVSDVIRFPGNQCSGGICMYNTQENEK